MSFTVEEIAYLKSQPIARVATLSADGSPTSFRSPSSSTERSSGSEVPAPPLPTATGRCGTCFVVLIVLGVAVPRVLLPR